MLNVDFFEEHARKFYHLLDKDSCSIELLVAFQERCATASAGLVYSDPYVMAQLYSGAQGACFLFPNDLDTTDFDGLIGKNVMEVFQCVPDYIRIILLDALYHHINQIEGIDPTEELEFYGNANTKSATRARKLLELAGVKSGSKVAIVGLVVDVVDAVLAIGAIPRVADMLLANSEVSGLAVADNAEAIVEWADIALITGNTLKTNSIERLLNLATKSGTRTLVFAMTGHNIAPRYLNYGADVVTSEEFPYYWYANVASSMKVYQ